MNRRGFLRFLGGVGVALAAANPLRLVAAQHRPAYDGTDCESLRVAIEALFPGDVLHSVAAFEEFCSDGSQVKRYIHQTFALGYNVTGDAAVDARLHRALYRSMYQTFVMMAERPENRNAVLVWRVIPQERRFDADKFAETSEAGDIVTSLPARVVLMVRASLKQTGWRERMGVEPWIRHGVKAEGAATELLS